MVQVSLSTSTTFDGDLNALVEDQGTALTVRFDLDEPAPEGGLKVFVDSEVEQIINRLDLLSFAGTPTVENINPNLLGTDFDNSGFFLTIDAGVTTASFTIDVFDNPEPDTFLPETFDGLVEAAFMLKTQDEVESQDLADVGTLGDYTIDPDAASSNVLFADEASQLTDTPEPPMPPEPPMSDLPLVSLHTGPDFLVEAEGTVSAHVFNVTNATIPEEGLLVSVSAPGLGEFDLDEIKVSEGGEIIAVREDGFDIRLTDFTVLVDLPIAEDGEVEGLEAAGFSLETGDGYEVNDAFGSGEFTIADTAEEVPNNFSEPNDTIPLASETELSPDNPQVKIIDTLEFQIGNRYPNEDGSFTYIDTTEDVDFYKFDLKAGDIVSFDTDAGVGFDDDLSIAEVNGFGSFFADAVDVTLNVYDDQGNSIANNDYGTGPGELFAGAFDAYIEFQAPEDGTYYLGVAAFPNGLINRRFSSPEANIGHNPNLAYDPFVPASGSGENFGLNFPNIGEYELDISLNPDNLVDLPQFNRSDNTPPATVDLAQPGEPTVSLNFLDYTIGPLLDEIISDGLVENLEVPSSTIALIVTTEGEIPEEGVVVTVNSDIYLRDYFTDFSLLLTPFSPGAELIDVVTDDSGIETGFQLRIFEPNISLAFNFVNKLYDAPLANEVDGPETATFFLEGGEGYGVSPSSSQITTTFYDSLEQVPEPSVIPEVSMTISEAEIIESEGTETTLNFSLSEPPPEGGVLVYVQGPQGILSQFDVLNANVSGGAFPVPDGALSGFYFKITEQEAAISLAVFADPFEEGLQSYNLALQETSLYTIDEDAGEVDITIADTPNSVLEVSLSSSEDALVESENTVGVLTFNLTALPPESGIEVTVNAPDRSEFDASAFTVTGGEITEVTDTDLSLNITDATAIIELSALLDDEAEGVETATFSLVASPDYLINPSAPETTFTLVDIPEQVPSPTEESNANDTIPEAVVLNLNPENTNATIRGVFDSLEPDGDFSTDVKDPTEDVDLYAFDLGAGDTVQIDIDSLPFESSAFEGIEQQLDSELRLFDAAGNELAIVNNAAAPDEEFSRDPYLEFTAESAGTYYVGVSQLGNTDYDPNVKGSGSGWIFPEIGVFYGEYELNVSFIEALTVIPTPGDDTLTGTEDDDIIAGDLGNDIISGNAGEDILRGDLNSRSPQDDVMGGNDIIFGGEGNDRIGGKAGNDILSGDAGDDMIWGDDGDDILMGVTGNDILIGDNFSDGSGSDLFVFGSGDGTDTVLDFEVGIDRIGIVEGEFTFADVTLTQDGANTLLGVAGETLAILNNVVASALGESDFATVSDVSNPEEALAII